MPTIDNLYMLSYLFGVSIDDIVCGNRPELRKDSNIDRRILIYYNLIRKYVA